MTGTLLYYIATNSCSWPGHHKFASSGPVYRGLGHIKLIISFSSTCPYNFDEGGRILFVIFSDTNT